MTTLFDDEFSGAGSLAGHTPDVGLGAEVWASPTLVYAAGVLTNPAAAGDPLDSGTIGDGVTDYGVPSTGTLSFSFITGADVSLGTLSTQWLQLLVAYSGSAAAIFGVRLSDDGSVFTVAELNLFTEQVDTTVAPAALTTYTGTLTITPDAIAINFMGVHILRERTAATPPGINAFEIDLAGSFSVGPLVLDSEIIDHFVIPLVGSTFGTPITGYIAAPLDTTAFGGPVSFAAAPLAGAAFGTATLTPLRVASLNVTAFGTPIIYPYCAAGLTGSFGMPAGGRAREVRPLQTTRFGTPTTVFRQRERMRKGLRSTSFGHHVAWKRLVASTAVIRQVDSIDRTQFGYMRKV